jgi:hypothetical protein
MTHNKVPPHERMRALVWLRDNFTRDLTDRETVYSKRQLYLEYMRYAMESCGAFPSQLPNPGFFGHLVSNVFPKQTYRRVGPRHSREMGYVGLRRIPQAPEIDLEQELLQIMPIEVLFNC